MIIRVFNFGIELIPEKITEQIQGEISSDGIILKDGLLYFNQLPFSKKTAMETKVDRNLDKLRQQGVEIIFFIGHSSSKVIQTAGSKRFKNLFDLEANLEVKKEISEPYIIALIGHKRYDLTIFCTIMGSPTKDNISNFLLQLSKFLNFDFNPDIIKLTKREIISFAGSYLDENHKVHQLTTDLLESEMSIIHHENVFNDPDVKEIDDALLLEEKVNRGDWKYLGIKIKNRYILGISKKYLERFYIEPDLLNYEILIESCLDVLKRIFAVKGKSIIRNRKITSYFEK